MEFQVPNEGTRKEVAGMCGSNVMLPTFKVGTNPPEELKVAYKHMLDAAGSPIAFLQDLLYAEPGMPEGSVAQLLRCKDEERAPLRALLHEYADVFPAALPKVVPPNRSLGDEHRIPLVEGAQPIK